MHRLAEDSSNAEVQFAYFFLHPWNIFLAQRLAVFLLLDNR